MRVVLDTNVLVSALLTPTGIPAQVVTLLLAGELVALWDERILREYREVLARPALRLPSDEVEMLMEHVESAGEYVQASAVTRQLLDPDDQPFLEVAIAGRAHAIVTGNARHFPEDLGVTVLSPRALLIRLEDE